MSYSPTTGWVYIPVFLRTALEAWDPMNQKLLWRIEGGGGIGAGNRGDRGQPDVPADQRRALPGGDGRQWRNSFRNQDRPHRNGACHHL